MENKIYNAIQKGLVNALTFDNDSSISYQKSDITSEMDFLKVSLDEIYDIFNESPIDIFKYYDTRDCLSLILDDNSEISLHEYSHDIKPIFLKISNDMLKYSNNEIIIACDKNHYIDNTNRLIWKAVYRRVMPPEYLIKNMHAALNDFNGYANCQRALSILANTPNLYRLPAIEYCNRTKTPLSNYKGYLPAIGQLNFITKYIDMLNYIFEYMGFTGLNLISNSLFWWSSSEQSYRCVWALYNGSLCAYRGKYGYDVLPFFKFLK